MGPPERLNRAAAGSDAHAESQARVRQDQFLLYQNQLDLTQRRATLEAEIKQHIIDQRKEFMKGFMTAGPDEMLQKLAAFRVNKSNPGGLSQGAFFGMGSAMRGNLGQLNPRYNPEGMFMQAEKFRLDQAGRRQPIEDVQKAMRELMQNFKDTLTSAFSTFMHVGGKGEAGASTGGGFSALIGGAGDAPKDALLEVANKIQTGGASMAAAMETVANRILGILPMLNAAQVPPASSLQLPHNAQSGGVGGGAGFTDASSLNIVRRVIRR